ncbi:NAD-dependent protein deacylase [Gehongia tenuis]|uniref:NAD-dependent protein deacetylase n=1 Tax=Gehongia tenuis TaxID=2763655 RepID=A0A926D645_9FIRM|nr:NAD-dependent protein deacylase [Gehongia tenuis]MBC8532351.1 NAD-dependent protein deacylase [Gehongia tenuis]
MERLEKLIEESRNIVFFGGAGVSTESGIPDFRSVDGLYRQKFKYPPETMLSHDFFAAHTAEFFDFYRAKMLCLSARPNAAHLTLARWEKAGLVRAVITQNIDGLHQMAGSQNVLELHGSVHRNHCLQCGKNYDAEWMLESRGVPQCSCGGVVKPDVVLYGESLDNGTLTASVKAIFEADALIIAGTSLAVYPAASLIDAYRGDRLIVINRSPTPADHRANLLIQGSVGEVLAALHV